MTMTKKDYELTAKGIAAVYHHLLAAHTTSDNATQKAVMERQAVAIEQVATELSSLYRSDNPMFDSNKFMNAAIWNVTAD